MLQEGFLHFSLSNALSLKLMKDALVNLLGKSSQEFCYESIPDESSFGKEQLTLTQALKALTVMKLSGTKFAIGKKTLEHLFLAAASSNQETGLLMADLVKLVDVINLLETINPMFVTHSPFLEGSINLCPAHDFSMWSLLLGTKVINIDEPVFFEPIAVSLLRSIASSKMSHQSFIIHKVGRSKIANQGQSFSLEVCQSVMKMPDSMASKTALGGPLVSQKTQVTCFLSLNEDIAALLNTLLRNHGEGFSYEYVFTSPGMQSIRLSFLCNKQSIEPILKVLYKHTNDVLLGEVQVFKQAQREVAIDVGTKNKPQIVRFTEYLYLDQVTKVEPNFDDLALYAKKIEESFVQARKLLLASYRSKKAE